MEPTKAILQLLNIFLERLILLFDTGKCILYVISDMCRYRMYYQPGTSC